MSDQDLERRDRIFRFAVAYVGALGLVGDDAARIRSEIEEKLLARQLLDDAALVTRVRRAKRDKQLRAAGASQEEIDATREQLYGTTAADTYRGQLSSLLELEVQGDASARQRVDEQLDAARRDDRVAPEQLALLERLVRKTRGEDDRDDDAPAR
jgi:hypothetical protein